MSTCTTAPATLSAAGNCLGHAILVGTALSQSDLTNTSYATAAKEFNFATPENEMKWDTTEATQNNFNFAPGDKIVTFAKSNNMKVKGHTLVWHSQLPSWVASLGSASAVQAAMLNHINTEMAHFKGQVVAWDVVNEAWETDSKITGNGNAKLGSNPFSQYITTNPDDANDPYAYISLAFKTARAADPNVLLFYNDYSIEGMNDKSTAVYNMVKYMLAHNVPIDGVGFQTHIGTPNFTPPLTPDATDFAQNLKRFTDLGLKVNISEMDVNCCDGYSLAQEGNIYEKVAAACADNPGCYAITVWGVQDSGSWLNSFKDATDKCGSGVTPTPLLFDNNYSKKPAYTGLMNALYTGK